LGNLLKRAGEPKGAQDAYREAVEIYDHLEVGSPTFPYRDDFDRTLNDYAVFLDGTDDPKLVQLSLGAYVRATNIYSGLAKTNPTEYEPRLAKALNNLGTLQKRLGPAAPASATLEQALAVYRRLVERDPATYRETLADALSDFAYCLSEGADTLAARKAYYEEALDQYRKLAPSKAWTHRSGFALTLNNYAILLDAAGDSARAQKAYEDALGICRAGGYYADMVLVLNNLAGRLQNARDYAKARDRYTEALKACDQLREKEPAAFGVNLAKTRLGLASLELREAATLGSDQANHLKAAESELAKAREALKPLPRSTQVNKLVQRERELSADLANRLAHPWR
jgi:tetratricopeptide (TPR) repeat protein